MSEYRCPVCRAYIRPDADLKIRKHPDGIEKPCPAAGLPFRVVNA